MVIAHSSVQQFLSVVRPALLEHELDNNLVLGICESLKNEPSSEYLLLSVVEEEHLQAVALKTIGNLLIGNISDSHTAIAELAQ